MFSSRRNIYDWPSESQNSQRGAKNSHEDAQNSIVSTRGKNLKYKTPNFSEKYSYTPKIELSQSPLSALKSRPSQFTKELISPIEKTEVPIGNIAYLPDSADILSWSRSDRQGDCFSCGESILSDCILVLDHKSSEIFARDFLFHRVCFPVAQLVEKTIGMTTNNATLKKLGDKTIKINGKVVPLGWVSVRKYRSTRHKSAVCDYESEVVQRELEDPVFVVRAVGKFENFQETGKSANEVWTKVMKKVRKLDETEREWEKETESWLEPLSSAVEDVGKFHTNIVQKPGVVLPSPPKMKTNRASMIVDGDHYFGYDHPEIQRIITTFFPSLDHMREIVANRGRYFRALFAARRIQKCLRTRIFYPIDPVEFAKIADPDIRHIMLRKIISHKILRLKPSLAAICTQMTMKLPEETIIHLCRDYAALKKHVLSCVSNLVSTVSSSDPTSNANRDRMKTILLERVADRYPEHALAITQRVMSGKPDRELDELLRPENAQKLTRLIAYVAFSQQSDRDKAAAQLEVAAAAEPVMWRRKDNIPDE